MVGRVDADTRLLTAVREELAEQDADIVVPAGDLAAVVAAGRRRQRSQVIGRAAAAVAVFGLWAVAVVGIPTGSDVPVIDKSSPAADAGSDASPTDADDVTSPDDTEPSASATSTTEGGATPAPSTSPLPTIEDARLVVATDDGIRRQEGDTMTSVPGIDTPVRVAFDGGDGDVVFQRTETGIGRLRNGEVSTLVALDEFGPRSFPGLVGDARALPPVALDLRDVDPVSGRIAFTVTWGTLEESDDGDATPVFVTEVFVSGLDGRDRRSVDSALEYEAGYRDIALAGRDVLLHPVTVDAGGRYELAGGDGDVQPVPGVQHPGFGATSDNDVAFMSGAGVDEDRLAVLEQSVASDVDEGALTLFDIRTGERLASQTLTRPGPVGRPVALDGQLVLLLEFLPDGGARSWLLDLVTGEATEIAGRASLAR